MTWRFAAGAALLLAGCAGTSAPPDVPPLVMPVSWRTAADTAAPVDRGWWRGFGDPMLSDWVERALAHNTDVALAAARVQEARAQERVARSVRWPSLDFSLPVSRTHTLNALGRESTSTTTQPVFQAAYEVDLFGRLAQQIDAAAAGVASAEAARDATRLSVASAVATGYITLRMLDARLDILRATLVSRADALKLATRRAAVGYTSDLEQRQAEAEYEATAQLIPQAEAVIARQENALAVLVGEAPGDTRRGTPLAALVAPPVPAGLPSGLLRQRPDIAQAEATLASTDATLAATRALFLPQVRLTASVGELFVSSLDDPLRIWSLGASVLAPIFSAGRIQGQVDAADARRDQAAWSYRRTVLVALREVEDNLAALQKLQDQRVHLQAQQVALSEALRHATNRYRAGYSPYLEQLDAQRSLLNAELSLAQVVSDQLLAAVALNQAVGGGWRPDR